MRFWNRFTKVLVLLTFLQFGFVACSGDDQQFQEQIQQSNEFGEGEQVTEENEYDNQQGNEENQYSQNDDDNQYSEDNQYEDNQYEDNQYSEDNQYENNQYAENDQYEDNEYDDNQYAEDNQYENGKNEYANNNGQENEYGQQYVENEENFGNNVVNNQSNGEINEFLNEEEPVEELVNNFANEENTANIEENFVSNNVEDIDNTVVANDTDVEEDPIFAEEAPQNNVGEEFAAPAGSSTLPADGTTMAYVVESGDTLKQIATRIYGDSNQWRDIASLSNLANPNRIFPGDVVYYNLDGSSRSFAQAYEAQDRGLVTVQNGDTLTSIAQRVYGTSSSWKSIWRQNDTINNPDTLEVGAAVYFLQKGSLVSAVDGLADQVAKASKKTYELGKSILFAFSKNNTKSKSVSYLNS